jgi:hypothetical protein
MPPAPSPRLAFTQRSSAGLSRMPCSGRSPPSAMDWLGHDLGSCYGAVTGTRFQSIHDGDRLMGSWPPPRRSWRRRTLAIDKTCNTRNDCTTALCTLNTCKQCEFIPGSCGNDVIGVLGVPRLRHEWAELPRLVQHGYCPECRGHLRAVPGRHPLPTEPAVAGRRRPLLSALHPGLIGPYGRCR